MLLAAYKKIGEVLPDFAAEEGHASGADVSEQSILPEASIERQQLLAFIYDDLLEYHQCIYEALNRQGKFLVLLA